MIKLRFGARMLVIPIKQTTLFFFIQVKKNCLKKFNKRLEFCFNSIQNSHVHEPRKLAENLPHLYNILPPSKTKTQITVLKSLGFSVWKYIVFTFC